MNKSKKYFCEAINEDFCYGLSYFIEEMKEQELTELTVALARRDTDKNYFFCSAHEVCINKTDDAQCGNECTFYEPRNGKKGCCKNRKPCYEPGDEFTLTVDGKLTPVKSGKS